MKKKNRFNMVLINRIIDKLIDNNINFVDWKPLKKYVISNKIEEKHFENKEYDNSTPDFWRELFWQHQCRIYALKLFKDRVYFNTVSETKEYVDKNNRELMFKAFEVWEYLTWYWNHFPVSNTPGVFKAKDNIHGNICEAIIFNGRNYKEINKMLGSDYSVFHPHVDFVKNNTSVKHSAFLGDIILKSDDDVVVMTPDPFYSNFEIID